MSAPDRDFWRFRYIRGALDLMPHPDRIGPCSSLDRLLETQRAIRLHEDAFEQGVLAEDVFVRTHRSLEEEEERETRAFLRALGQPEEFVRGYHWFWID